MTSSLTFLGTGNYLAPPGRYWNSFLVEAEDLTVLVEPSPTALPNLRRAGSGVDDLDVVMISHFHPDHTFGWPFLLLELAESQRSEPLVVAGPPGVEAFLSEMMRLGSVAGIEVEARGHPGLAFVEADPSSTRQSAGPLGFSAIEVEHVPELSCFGYLLELGGHTLGYTGDVHPCPGLDELAGRADTLVVECAGAHASRSHMDVASLRSLAERFPSCRMVATHLGDDVEAAMLPGVEVPDDFSRLELA